MLCVIQLIVIRKPADALKAFTEKANETIKKLQNNKH